MDLTKLSDAELDALYNEELQKAQKAPTSQDLSNLSDEELEAAYNQELEKVAPGAAFLSQFEQREQQRQQQAEQQGSQLTAGAMGLAQGVTLGFADEIGGAAQTIGDTVSQVLHQGEIPNLPEIQQTYKKNRDELRASFEKAEEDHKGSFLLGDIVGGLVMPMGAGKALGKQMIKYGAAQGLGRSEGEKSYELAMDVAVGAGLGAAGYKVGELFNKGFKTAGGKVQDIADGERFNKFLDGIGVRSSVKTIKLRKSLNNQNIPKEEFVDKLSAEISSDGLPVFHPSRSMEELDDIIAQQVGFLDSVKKQVIEEAETALRPSLTQAAQNIDLQRPTTFIDSGVITKRVFNEIDDIFSNKVLKDNLNLKNKIKDDLVTSLKVYDSGGITFKDAFNFKQELQQKVKNWGRENTNIDSQEVYQRLSTTVKNIIDDGLLKSDGLNPAIRSTYMDANKRMSLLLTAKESVSKTVESRNLGVFGIVKESLQQIREIAPIGIDNVSSKNPVKAAVGTLKSLMFTPNLSMEASYSLGRLANAAEKNPTIARMLLERSAASGPAFLAAASYADAFIEFKEAPLQRTSQAVIENADRIQALLDMEDPETAKMFAKAVESEDRDLINGIMNQVSTSSSAAKLIAPGIGWDGMAISEGDKKTVENQIKKSSISSSKKAMLMQKFKQDRMIPQIEEDAPFFKVYDPALKTSVMR